MQKEIDGGGEVNTMLKSVAWGGGQLYSLTVIIRKYLFARRHN